MEGVKRALPLLLGLGLSVALATPRLGDPLPAHPWTDAPTELVVLYSHDCGDLTPLWGQVAAAGLPVRLVNAEDVPIQAPKGFSAWQGEAATDFSRALRVRVYPTVLLVQAGRVMNLWEGTFNVSALR